MASGDKCVFGKDSAGRADCTIIHYDCDDYADGTITDVRTGDVVGRKRPTPLPVQPARMLPSALTYVIKDSGAPFVPSKRASKAALLGYIEFLEEQLAEAERRTR